MDHDVASNLTVDLGGHFALPPGPLAIKALPDWLRTRVEGAVRILSAMDRLTAEQKALADLTSVDLAILRRLETCPECGIQAELTIDGAAVGVTQGCAHPGGYPVFSVEIDVPSGRLVFANDLRDLVQLKTLDDSHYVNHTHEVARCSRDYADVGMVHIITGNSCPDVYRRPDGSLAVLNPGYDRKRDTDKAVKGEKLGGIDTSLWWFSAMDEAAFLDACAARGLDPDDFDAFTVDVEPGRWAFSSRLHLLRRSGDYDRGTKERVYSEGRRVGACLGPRAEPEVPTTGIALFDSHLWKAWTLSATKYPMLHPTMVEWLEHMYCVLGNGLEWQGGVIRSRGGDARWAATLDDPKIKDLIGSDVYDRVPALPAAALEGFATGRKRRLGVTARKVYPMAAEYVTAGEMPLAVDRFYLAAALMLFKALHEHPEHLDDAEGGFTRNKPDGTPWTGAEIAAYMARHHAEQVDITRQCLNLMLTLSVEAGLWQRPDAQTPAPLEEAFEQLVALAGDEFLRPDPRRGQGWLTGRLVAAKEGAAPGVFAGTLGHIVRLVPQDDGEDGDGFAEVAFAGCPAPVAVAIAELEQA